MGGSFTGSWYPDLTEFADAKIVRQGYVADAEAKATTLEGGVVWLQYKECKLTIWRK